MISRATILACGLALLGIFALAACTITETWQDGARTRSITLGPAVLPASGSTYSARARGIGLAVVARSGVVGLFDVRTTHVGRDCFALFVVPDATEAARIAALLPPGTCSTQGD